MKEKSLKILVLGSGGREHALCWKITQSPLLDIHLAKGDKLGARVETTSTAEESVKKRPKNASKSKNEKTKNETKNSQQGKLFE